MQPSLYAQEDIDWLVEDWEAHPHQINGEMDVASGRLSYNYVVNRFFSPGIGAKVGWSMSLSLTEGMMYLHREHISYSIYNRMFLSECFTLDYGLRFSQFMTLVDHSPRHGFSHLSYWGGYINPMYHFGNLSIGTSFGVGLHRSYSFTINPFILRYTIRL